MLARLFSVMLVLGMVSCSSSRVQVSKESLPRQKQWAEVCKDCAMLSTVVYRDRIKKLRKEVVVFEGILKDEGWRRLGVGDHTKGSGEGLYFEVWENRSLKPRKIIIAFRGTEHVSGVDWRSNLRWFRIARRKPDQYDVSRQEALPLVFKYFDEAKGEKPMIVTTGHSMGGGIAQGIFYAAATKVDHCVAFDPSPVTGYFDLEPEVRTQYLNLPHRNTFPQYRVISAYEDGEFMQVPRNLVNAFYKPDSLFRSIAFHSKKRGPMGQHNIAMLAHTIRDITRQPYAEHPFVSTKLSPLEFPAYVEDAVKRVIAPLRQP